MRKIWFFLSVHGKHLPWACWGPWWACTGICSPVTSNILCSAWSNEEWFTPNSKTQLSLLPEVQLAPWWWAEHLPWACWGPWWACTGRCPPAWGGRWPCSPPPWAGTTSLQHRQFCNYILWDNFDTPPKRMSSPERYEDQAFLRSDDSDPCPSPSPPLTSANCLSFSIFLSNLYWGWKGGGGGCGAESYTARKFGPL